MAGSVFLFLITAEYGFEDSMTIVIPIHIHISNVLKPYKTTVG